MASDGFDLGVDLDCYRLENEGERPGIVFFARPDTARRGFELGMLALELFAADHPEIEIHVIGQHVQARGVPFAFTDHGHLPVDELAALYNRCRAGLVLSLTNLSLLPAELLAAGCIPVMNDGENTRASCDSELARFAQPEPLALARELDAGPRARRSSGAGLGRGRQRGPQVVGRSSPISSRPGSGGDSSSPRS